MGFGGLIMYQDLPCYIYILIYQVSSWFIMMFYHVYQQNVRLSSYFSKERQEWVSKNEHLWYVNIKFNRPIWGKWAVCPQKVMQTPSDCWGVNVCYWTAAIVASVRCPSQEFLCVSLSETSSVTPVWSTLKNIQQHVYIISYFKYICARTIQNNRHLWTTLPISDSFW